MLFQCLFVFPQIAEHLAQGGAVGDQQKQIGCDGAEQAAGESRVFRRQARDVTQQGSDQRKFGQRFLSDQGVQVRGGRDELAEEQA